MPSLEIHPLSGLREEAAALLAERFARQRAAERLLPEIEHFEPHLPADGLVATRGGEAVAYLAGAVEDDTARVGFAGCAASHAEALRDLFAVLAGEWGVSRFAVAVPATEGPSIEAFFRLAFGCQFVWAVSEIEADVAVQLQHTYVRPGTSADHEAAASFDEVLMRHQQRSPSFSGVELPSRDEMLAEWEDTWEGQDTFAHFVAEEDGRVVGHALLYKRPEGDLRVPPRNIDLAHAVVEEKARRHGVGLALFAHVSRYAYEQGYRSMTTDWRSVNLLSSRYWPNRGFRPQYLRLYRAIP
jgi:GNAT superfamily N-acetyltransferase